MYEGRNSSKKKKKLTDCSTCNLGRKEIKAAQLADRLCSNHSFRMSVRALGKDFPTEGPHCGSLDIIPRVKIHLSFK